MHLKASIALLSLAIVLVTSADDYYCDGQSTARSVSYSELIRYQWYTLFTDDPSYLESCATFKVDSVSYSSNLIVKTYLEKNGAYVVNSTYYLQSVGPGKFIMWNTSDPGFNPTQPGDVDKLGQFTFTTFLSFPLLNLDVITFKTCFPIEGIQYKSYQHVAIPRRDLGDAEFELLQTALQSIGFDSISKTLCLIK